MSKNGYHASQLYEDLFGGDRSSGISLTSFGYSISKPTDVRQKALRTAASAHSITEVITQLHRLRSLQRVERILQLFNTDITFMETLLSNEKRDHPTPVHERNKVRRIFKNKSRDANSKTRKTSKKKKSTSKTNKLRKAKLRYVIDQSGGGGSNRRVEDSDISSEDLDRVHVEYIYEEHKVDGYNIVFSTIGLEEADAILKLDLLYYDSDETLDGLKKRIQAVPAGQLIGVKSDSQLQGYVIYKPIDSTDASEPKVHIEWFCANKGFGTPLYRFLEAVLTKLGYSIANISVSLEGSYAVRRLNFWYRMGYQTVKIDASNQKIRMEKRLD